MKLVRSHDQPQRKQRLTGIMREFSLVKQGAVREECEGSISVTVNYPENSYSLGMRGLLPLPPHPHPAKAAA